MIVYEENPKESTKKLLEVKSEFSKATEYKVNMQKNQVYFYILLTNNWEKNFKYSIVEKRQVSKK